LSYFFGNLQGLSAPYSLSFAAADKGNYNLNNYVNQTEFPYLYDNVGRFFMKAGSSAINNLNASVTIRTAKVFKTCYFTLNIAKPPCETENKILKCCADKKPDTRYQSLYSNLFYEYKQYKARYNSTSCT
jgi:hypothetical protein